MTKEEKSIKKDLIAVKKDKAVQASIEMMDVVMDKYLSMVRLVENWIKYTSMDDKTGKEIAKGRRIKNIVMKEMLELGFEVSRDQFSGEVVRIVYDPNLRKQAKKRKVKHVNEK